MKKPLFPILYRKLNQWLDHLSRVKVLSVALILASIIGVLDFLSGFEVSFALFYLLPVAGAAWYAGYKSGVTVAVFSCLCWFAADRAAGSFYSHPLIPVWNAVVRLGFFVVVTYLTASLNRNLKYLRGLALLDGLTRMYRRPAFEQRLEHDLALAARQNKTVTVAYIDLDNFKSVNDRFGHAEGDRVLRLVGQVLNEGVRKSDTAARLGGDEFALILPGMGREDAQRFVFKIHETLQKALAKHQWGVTCSVGVVTSEGTQIDRETMVASADKLMYQVKHGGKGAVAFDVMRSD